MLYILFRMLTKPWRLVMPATIFFCLMMIVSITHSSLLRWHLLNLCDQLREAQIKLYPDSQTLCGYLIEQFSPIPADALMPGSNYNVLQMAITVKAIMWLIALIVMVVRVIFAVDFELLRVSVEAKSTLSMITQETMLIDNE